MHHNAERVRSGAWLGLISAWSREWTKQSTRCLWKDLTHMEEENCSEDSDDSLSLKSSAVRNRIKLKFIGLVFLKQTCTPRSYDIVTICWVPPRWAKKFSKEMNRNGNTSGSQTWKKMLHLTHKRNANQNYSKTGFFNYQIGKNPTVWYHRVVRPLWNIFESL